MADQLSYKTLREENSEEFIINKSRFIGYGCPCQTEEEALAFLARIRQKHKDATHNCYAYIIGLNSGIIDCVESISTPLSFVPINGISLNCSPVNMLSYTKKSPPSFPFKSSPVE